MNEFHASSLKKYFQKGSNPRVICSLHHEPEFEKTDDISFQCHVELRSYLTEMSQNLIFLNNCSWGTLILKNNKLGFAAQTKLSLHAFIFVTNA
jgi:hypothetical protein